KSTFLTAAASNIFREEVPRNPTAGVWNAAVLNHCARDCVKPECGSDTTLATWSPVVLPILALSIPVRMENGCPLRNVTIPEVSQPPRNAFATAGMLEPNARPLPNGRL